MAEASWGAAASPGIDWRMSAALQDVPRGDGYVAEVTSLEGAVREWLELDPAHQDDAILIPERPLLIEGVSMIEVRGDNIDYLAQELPDRGVSGAAGDQPLDTAG